jgi:preprotein translocase subunit YajC
MLDLLAGLPIVFAEDAGDGGALKSFALTFIPLIAVAYILLVWPHQKQERQRRAMIDGLKKNDKIITTGGIYGTVVSVDAKQDKVMVRVDDEKGVKLALSRASVGRVIESSEKSTDGI